MSPTTCWLMVIAYRLSPVTCLRGIAFLG